MDSIHKVTNGIDRMVKHFTLFLIELNFDNSLHAFGSDDSWYAYVKIFDAIFSRKPSSTGENAFFIFQVRFCHGNGRGSWRIKGGSCFQKVYDFSSSLAGALDNSLNSLMGCPPHLNKVGKGNSCHCRISNKRDHAIPMTAKYRGVYIFDRYIKFLRQKIAEARTIQNACHADNAFVGNSCGFPHNPHHNIQGIRDYNNESFRAILANAFPYLANNFCIYFEQVITAHSWFPGNTCGNDNEICPFQVIIIIGAPKIPIKPFNGGGFSDIQGFTLRRSLHDINKNHISELFKAHKISQGSSNLTCSYKGNFWSCHDIFLFVVLLNYYLLSPVPTSQTGYFREGVLLKKPL